MSSALPYVIALATIGAGAFIFLAIWWSDRRAVAENATEKQLNLDLQVSHDTLKKQTAIIMKRKDPGETEKTMEKGEF